jgi:plasmid stabilization system protein ParE
MRVVYTDEALAELELVLKFIADRYPAAYSSFEQRLRAIEARISAWPASAQEVAQRPGVRAVPFLRYPYTLFY